MKWLLITIIFVTASALCQEDDFAVPTESEPIMDPNSQAAPAIEGVPTISDVQTSVPAGYDPALEGFLEENNYTPQDKRDPFFPFLMLQKIKIVNEKQQEVLEPLQQFALNELKVIGIIWDVGKPKALVVDPKGKSHIIAESAKMGKDFGYVAAIREGEIIVIEEQLDSAGKRTFLTKILKISNSAGAAQ